MEKITLKDDVKVICVAAQSFPDKVKEAFESLYPKIPNHDMRTTYEISTFVKGQLGYKAAFSRLPNDQPKKWGVETDSIQDLENHLDQFQPTFQKLGNSEYETDMPGIEWYQAIYVKCMLHV